MYHLTITSLPGLEQLLAQEVEQIGGVDIDIGRRSVKCRGNLETIYKLNIECHTALRVLRFLKGFDIADEEEMYRALSTIDWKDHFDVSKTFAIRAVFGRHRFKNTHYFSLKAKDAIVDHFNYHKNRRPSIDTKYPEVGIYLYYDSGTMEVYLDSSGYSLHKRGYKKFAGRASINETLGAAMFSWSGWKPGQAVINPMCGAGTLAIEAVFRMTGNSPQVKRKYFSYEHWLNFDQTIHRTLQTNKITTNEIDVLCSDIDEQSVKGCRENINFSGLSEHIHSDQEDFFEMDPIENSIILLNPPYDKRMREDDIIKFYKKIGDTLKFKWKNCRCLIISGNLEAFKFIGLRPNKKYKVFNGSIPAEVRIFDIY